MWNPLVFLDSGVPKQAQYTNPSSSVTLGASSVLTVNGRLYFLDADIPPLVQGSISVDGAIWQGAKDANAWTLGYPIYYNPNGTATLDGTNAATLSAGSGCFTSVYSAGVLYAGIAVQSNNDSAAGASAAAAGDPVGYFAKSDPADAAPLIGGSVTASVASPPTLGGGMSLVTNALGGSGAVTLPNTYGQQASIDVVNLGAVGLVVNPPAAGTINAIGSNAGITMAAHTVATYKTLNGGVNWYSFPLVPS